MPLLRNYPVVCHGAGCTAPGPFKIAARWTDGATQELKTYSLACAECVPGLLAEARAKHAVCRTAEGEILDPPGVYDRPDPEKPTVMRWRSDLES